MRSVQQTICIVVSLCLFTTADSAFSQTAPNSTDTDRATLIILAPAGLVFVDLHLTVSRLPYREWVARFLVQEMDTDQSGRLSEVELGLLTESIKTLIHVKDAAQILQAMNAAGHNDANDNDVNDNDVNDNDVNDNDVNKDVAADDFVLWLRNRMPRAFDLIAQPQLSDDAVRLASLLDTDYDGAISEDELMTSSRTLRFRDLDNDETFSVSELLPYRDPRSQNSAVTPDAVSLPFFHVVDHDSAQRATQRILQQYGSEGFVPESVLRQVRRIDAAETSDDSELSGGEVQKVVEDPAFHILMDVSLSVKANTSNVTVTVSRDAAAFCVPAEKQKFGEYNLAIDRMPLRILALGGSANDRRNTQGYLGQTFVMSDGDRNQYLDEAEFFGMTEALNRSGATASFASVDLNGDGMITRAEIFSFVKRDQMAAASHVEVSVKQEGKSLFGILDRNGDRRLSRRELIAGSSALEPYDLNQDRKFADAELGTAFVLAISLGRPEFRRTSGQTNTMAMQMGAGDAILPRLESMQGPEWFRRMDRNQDGDISFREFLGTSQQFKKIDTDNDRLISAEEALAIEPAR